MKTIRIPHAVRTVLDVLHGNGEEAYIVGGCVRDSIMGKEPKDWDVTTSATPMQVKGYFARTIDTGIKHGTVTVMMEGEPIEVTTFRVDGEYKDHRRPTTVNFTTSLREDVARRDFTVNAMAYSDATGLIDYFGGQQDLADARIRCVGVAEERFEEDALRMMRAVRFASVLNFALEEDTAKAIIVKKDLIKAVSQERIRVEFLKTLQSSHPDYISYFQEYGLSPHFLPEIDVSLPSVKQRILWLKSLPVGNCRLAALFTAVGTGKEAASKVKKILRRMTFDNHSIQIVAGAVQYFDASFEQGEYSFRKLLSVAGWEVTEILLQIAVVRGIAGPDEQLHFKNALTAPVTIQDLAINGQDLIALGIKEGKKIGLCLNKLLEIVLKNPEDNYKENLLNFAKRFCEK